MRRRAFGAFAGLIALTGASALGGCFLRTPWVLAQLNEGSSKPNPGPPPPVFQPVERIARFTQAQLADSYVDPVRVAGWMRAFAQKPDAILALAQCLLPKAGGDAGPCYDDFSSKVVRKANPDWGLGAPPDPAAAGVDLVTRPDTVELDTQRFLANVTALAPSLMAFRQAVGQELEPQKLRDGLSRGANAAADYVVARRWHRQLKRPTNGLVLAGGAANGAFSAGAIYRLLTILDHCKRVATADGGCGDARIDFVAGTSTGSLIGTLVDVFHTRGREQEAKKLLISNYTCTTAYDLYCENSEWIWRLGTKVTGLVRFDGIEKKLQQATLAADIENDTELVTVAVDYASSHLFAISDQDPADLMPLGPPPNPWKPRLDGRIQGVLASIVEPVLGEPIAWVPSSKGRVDGAFMDGGVRSHVPILQAAMRGAERVAVFVNAGTETGSNKIPPHAFKILTRTIDLFITQSRVGEVQQAEFTAVARRFSEYNVCKDRLEELAPDDATKAEVAAFCARRGAGFDPPQIGPEQAAPSWLGPARFEQVATSWRTSWVYQPEVGLPSASAYAFDPNVMRPLFLGGVKVFQERCQEMRRLFNIGGKIADAACKESPDVVAMSVEREFAPIGQCTVNLVERRTCE